MQTYTLAHPLDAKIQRGTRWVDNPLNPSGEDLAPGDPIELDDNQAHQLARAGYLNLDKNGQPAPALTASDVPPRGGEGSGRDEWAAYAGDRIEVTDDMDRGAIIAALDAAGIATHRTP